MKSSASELGLNHLPAPGNLFINLYRMFVARRRKVAMGHGRKTNLPCSSPNGHDVPQVCAAQRNRCGHKEWLSENFPCCVTRQTGKNGQFTFFICKNKVQIRAMQTTTNANLKTFGDALSCRVAARSILYFLKNYLLQRLAV